MHEISSVSCRICIDCSVSVQNSFSFTIPYIFKMISIRRVWTGTLNNGEKNKIGWVHEHDLNNCMHCGRYGDELDKFKWRHCRKCGNLVCKVFY